MKACDEEKLLGHLGVVLYEYLGEEYPDVLGSILGALKAIVNVIGMTVSAPMSWRVKGGGVRSQIRFLCSPCGTMAFSMQSWAH